MGPARGSEHDSLFLSHGMTNVFSLSGSQPVRFSSAMYRLIPVTFQFVGLVKLLRMAVANSC